MLGGVCARCCDKQIWHVRGLVEFITTFVIPCIGLMLNTLIGMRMSSLKQPPRQLLPA